MNKDSLNTKIQCGSLLKVSLKTHILLLLLTVTIFALHAQDFEVAPAKMYFSCEAGQIQTKTLTVHNHANKKQQFALMLGDMKFDTSNIISNSKNMNARSCKDWVTLNPSFFDLNPNESRDIKVVMQVPPDQSSTREALIYVSATEEQTALDADVQMRSAVKVRPRIAIKVFQSPKSNTDYKGAISNLKEITQATDSVRSFQAKVLNTGDKVMNGKVYLIISNLETAKEIKQRPLHVNLFPGISQTVVLQLPQNIPHGKYSLAAILDYGNNANLEAVQMKIEVK